MWSVLLVGGASGVGKTSISYRLARHYDAGLTEVDDFQRILEGMTTPAQYPVLHYWRTQHDEARRMNGEQHVAFMRRYAAIMSEALSLVIANHIETHAPVVLDGDFILPALAVQASYAGVPANGQVRALFLYEESEEQIAHNYRRREDEDQPERARVSWLVSQSLTAEAQRLGVPTLPASPWDTVLARAIAAVDAQHPPILD